MQVLLCVLLLHIFPIIKGSIQEIPTGSPERCLEYITKTYFGEGKEITFVDIKSDNNVVFKLLHSLQYKPLISRTSNIGLKISNDHYFVVTNGSMDFVNEFRNLEKDSFWNPGTRFLILVNNLNRENLKDMFDVLLKQHVSNVVILNDTPDPEIYTYNPYENFGCGRRYDKIIELGKCSKSKTLNLFPNKLVTGLRNCTFNVMLPHWPPFTINPSLNSSRIPLGVEEYVFREISALEGFNVNVSYNDYGENFTKITKNRSGVGLLMYLQNGGADVVFGGLLLTHDRAETFDYIYEYPTIQENLSYLVKKANQVPIWKNIYLGFDITVWVALLVTFLVYYFVLILLYRPKDKGQFILKMLCYFFLNGSRIRGTRFRNFIFIGWVWFAYLISSCYQSSFTSVTTHPIMNHQIKTLDDILKYKLQSCVSRTILDYMTSSLEHEHKFNQRKGCQKLLESIKIVSEDFNSFTITLNSIYNYYKFDFYNEYGKPKIYRIKQSLLKPIYSIYFYKGFPLVEKFQMHLMKLRENGLIRSYLLHMVWDISRQYRFKAKTRLCEIFVPWYILTFGCSVSTLVLFIEILVAKYNRKKVQNAKGPQR